MPRINLKEKIYIAIDLGTSKTKIFIQGKGIVYNEPTLIALDYKTRKVLAVGQKAKSFLGKQSYTVDIKSPLKSGVITDIKLLSLFLSKVLAKYKDDIKDSYITLACPVGVTKIEREAVIAVVKKLGVIYVKAEDDIKLALLGAGKDIEKPEGHLILDLGAGKASCGILTAGEIVTSRWSKSAGDFTDIEILKYLKTKHSCLIGNVSAEKVKNQIGSVVKSKKQLETRVYGYDISSGMPTEIVLKDSDILKVIQSIFGNLTILITSVLEDTPNELAGDVIKNGIIITGGLSNIIGTKFFFEDFFEIPVFIPKNASTAVIDGAAAYKNTVIKAYEEENKRVQKPDF